jgi:hypothetical protein
MTIGSGKRSAVHEDFSRDVEFKDSSNRAFGFTGAAALSLLGLWPLVQYRPLRPWALAIAVVLLVLALFRPQLLMQRLVTPAVMALVFYSTVTPVALVLRLLGKDLLSLQIDRTASTYWIERRPPGPAPDMLRQQF